MSAFSCHCVAVSASFGEWAMKMAPLAYAKRRIQRGVAIRVANLFSHTSYPPLICGPTKTEWSVPVTYRLNDGRHPCQPDGIIPLQSPAVGLNPLSFVAWPQIPSKAKRSPLGAPWTVVWGNSGRWLRPSPSGELFATQKCLLSRRNQQKPSKIWLSSTVYCLC